jgi:hypothetical protein
MFPFTFLCSDDEDPKRDATTAPSAQDITANEPPMPEVEPAVKSPKAPELLSRKFPCPGAPSGRKNRRKPMLPSKPMNPRTPLMM